MWYGRIFILLFSFLPSLYFILVVYFHWWQQIKFLRMGRIKRYDMAVNDIDKKLVFSAFASALASVFHTIS